MDSIELLKKIVSINSVFPNERKAAEFIEKILIENGFETSRLEISKDRFNVLGERGTRGKPILFYGHIDTVPPYGQWQGSPFELREDRNDRDILYGLGVVDMKAGVAAILKAVEEETDRKIKVAFGVDEENISEGAYAIAKSGFLKDVDIGISTEIATSQNQMLGPRAITLGRRGRCVIELEIPGKSAHGAQAEKGISAIDEAVRLINELEKLNNLGTHELLPPPTKFIRKINAESTSLSLPENALIELDIHMVIPETPETVLKTTEKFIEKLYAEKKFSEIDGRKIVARLKQRKTPYLPPYVIPKENEYVKKLWSIISEKIGEPVYNYGASVADENVFASFGIPMISIGPKGGDEHTSNEWLSKSSYLQLIDILKTFIKSC